jgi:hypothetical protein
MNATAIDHHDDLCLGGAKDAHHVMNILTEFVGIKMGYDLIEDARGAVLHGPNDLEQHASGDPTPAALLFPGLAFEALLSVDLALAQGASRQAIALAPSPPPAPRQGKAPKHRFILIKQNDLALARPVFQGAQFEAAIGQVGRVGIEPAGGATVA